MAQSGAELRHFLVLSGDYEDRRRAGLLALAGSAQGAAAQTAARDIPRYRLYSLRHASALL